MHLNTKPLVSVVLPVKNGEDYILQSLNSLIQQSYDNLEILVIDDQSTDSTLKLVQGLTDSRIKILSTSANDVGIVAALNLGLASSKGEFIARMDADDVCSEGRFEMQIKHFLQNASSVICGSWAKKFGSSNGYFKVPRSSAHIRSFAMFHSPFIHPAVMIRKSFIQQLKIQYEKEFDLSEDYRLWTRLLIAGSGKNFCTPLLNYRVHEKQHSLSNYELRKKNVQKIQIDWLISCGFNVDEKSIELHSSIVTDISFLARNPEKWNQVLHFYWTLNLQNLHIRNNNISAFWLLNDTLTTLFSQAAYSALVKLKLRG